MIFEALKYLVDLGREADKVQTVKHEGRTYATKQLSRVPDELPINDIALLEVNTLDALIEYLDSDPDGIVDDADGDSVGPIVHVVSPTRVDVRTCVLGEKQKRQYWMSAHAPVPRLLVSAAGDEPRAVRVDELAIHLRTCFVDPPLPEIDDEAEVRESRPSARSELVKFLGTWVETDKLTVEDDGVTQTVTVRSGLTLNAEGHAPSLMDLAPIRTFFEVRQPTSPFVLRCHKGGTCNLITADGGAWRNEAIAHVAKYLKYKLPSGCVLLS